MNNKAMEKVREQLNNMMASENCSKKELLKVSEKLDALILQYMKGEAKCNEEDKRAQRDMNELLRSLKAFEKMYEAFRIIDPVRKTVMEYVKNDIYNTDEVCHGFWKRNQICDNCISIRAHNEDNSFFKIEYRQDAVYLIIAVPTRINGRKFVIELLKNVRNNLYTDNGHCGMDMYDLIDNTNRIAVKDSLTGVFNRRYIDERLPVELNDAVTNSKPLSIILTDFDGFKCINDLYGHVTGDQILRGTAEIFVKCLGMVNGWVARYGGDEFLVCLPDTDEVTAKRIAEEMRKKIEGKITRVKNKSVRITASFGIYSIYGEDKLDYTVSDLIDRADKNMYKAKHEGKNKVV